MARMASTNIIVLSFIIFYVTTVSAFNITRLLDNHSEFSTFNDLLTQTGLANEINQHKTITVLVIDNSEMGSITGKPQSTIKKIMATHALLDYYDQNKISDFSKNGSEATNFFQNSGLAYKQQGQTKLTTSGGEVIFSSATDGAPKNSKMVKIVAAQPYNIAVIQISQPIVTPGIEQTTPSGPPPSGTPKATPPTPVAAPPPKKANKTESPAAASPTDDADVADGPDSDGPTSDGPASEGDEADKESPAKMVPSHKGNAAQMAANGGAVLGLMGLLALFL
ncbi:hypothetical protein RND81_08G188300 [Saponaria officinalis]|uniref:FAS1 domain-containing protein n=1 Tax=Saponaria officinalis TaxID=3572 RepID=A0AAW1JA24_SAPOF